MINDRAATLEGGTTITEEDEEVLLVVMPKTQTALGPIRRDSLSPRRPFGGKLREVTGKLSLWLGGLQNLIRSFLRQELTRNGPAGGSSFELCYKNDFQTPYMLPTTLLSFLFRGSFSDPDWQVDWPQVSSAMMCNVVSFDGIFTGWAKVFPTYVEHAIGFTQRIVKGSNS